MPQRPSHPTLNASHPLADRLVLAGIAPGGLVGSTHYRDSSVYGNHGTLTNMDPATDWVWSNELNRFALDFDGSDDQVTTTFAPAASASTVACWVNVTSFVANHAIWGKDSLAWNCFCDTSGRLDAECGIKRLSSSSDTAITAATWTHVCVTDDGTTSTMWINGVAKRTGTSDASVGTGVFTWGRKLSSYPLLGQLADGFFWMRALFAAEIAILADRSNVMLSGLILPPPRKLWAVTSGAPPAAFKAAWATKRQQLIGGGVL